MMLLVVDIVKGMQTQTAECLIIGEILCEKMVVVINKIDLVAENKRSSVIQKVIKEILHIMCLMFFCFFWSDFIRVGVL